MRLLLSGYYGFGNLGDEAILAGLVGALRDRGHEVTVLSADPVATARQHGVAAAHRTRGVIGALLRSDALVSGGGGLLQDITSRRSLTYYLATIRLARLLGKRVAVYGQSLGPLTDEGKRRVARALGGVPAFWRDEQSRVLARELGLDDGLTADAALLLAPVEPVGPNSSGPVLLVPRAGHAVYNDALKRSAEALSAEGVSLAAVALHSGHDDAEVADLQVAVPGLEVVPAPTPGELLARLPSMSYVISARLHGCVLAAAAGVGFAALSYDPKVEGFATLLAAPVFSQPVDAAELLSVAHTRVPIDVRLRRDQISGAKDGIDRLITRLGT